MPDLGKRPLRNITAEALAPLWSRHDIPTERIAYALNVTRQGLSYKAKALGLPSRARNQEPKKKVSDERFTRMWMAGVSTSEIAEACGYASRNAVSHRRVILGLPARTRGIGGRNHGGWRETISLAAFVEAEIAAQMAAFVEGERHG